MEKYKTLNNSYANDFFRCLSADNIHVCSYLLFNSRNMYEKRPYSTFVRHYFVKFPFANSSAIRECLRIFKIDMLVINHIVKLFNEWKGGVHDDKGK